MTGIVLFLALLFGGIAIWAGINLLRANRKPAARPRLRIIAPSPTDPRGALMMRQRERDLLRHGRRAI